ncbi:MAG: glycosyltransferase [Kiritimatiellae bacterium]|nr:glycosyltransferase [Kiritimatiellia bacterium]
MPTVFVVVPVYNVEPYLRDCLDSLLAQTLSGWKCLCVDDGSTDGSSEILSDYAAKDARFRVIRQENRGLSAARNAALDRLKTENADGFVAFLDSDDWLAPTALEDLANGSTAAGAGIAAAAFRPVPESASFADVLPNESTWSLLPAEDFWTRPDLLATTACGKLFPLAAFRDVRFPEGKLHEDEWTTYRIVFACGRIAATARPLYFYRQRSGSIMNGTWTARRTDALEALLLQERFFADSGRDVLVSFTRRRIARFCEEAIVRLRGAGSARARRICRKHLVRCLPDADRFSSSVARFALRARILPPRGAVRIANLADLAGRRGLGAVFLRVANRIWPPDKPVRSAVKAAILLPRNLLLAPFGRRRLAKTAAAARGVRVYLTDPAGFGGGAEYYVARIVATETPGNLSVLVHPIPQSRRLLVRIWDGPSHAFSFLAAGLADLARPLAGRTDEIVVNTIGNWARHAGRSAMDDEGVAALAAEILSLKDTLGCRLSYRVHDYASFCPRLFAMGDDFRHCDLETDEERCAACAAKGFSGVIDSAPGTDARRWRRTMAAFLDRMDEIRAFSEDSRRRMQLVFPGLPVTVVPHALPPPIRKPSIRFSRMSIGVFGTVAPYKGAFMVRNLAGLIKRLGLKIPITVVGRLLLPGGGLPPGVSETGPYRPDELPDIVEKEGINVVLFPGLIPETFSYVVHEIMQLGLPLACFDVGAPKDAVRAFQNGSIIPEETAESALETLRALFLRSAAAASASAGGACKPVSRGG